MDTSKRLQALNIIKGISMLMVIMVHYNQGFTSNITLLKFFQTGCQMLFVVSGFGIARSFSNKHSGTYPKAGKAFYISRLKAIAPAYYIMMAVIFSVNTLLIHLTGDALNFGSNRSPVAIICNILFLNGLFPFCNNNVMPGGWYIGTTMLLYLITPLLYFLFEKFNRQKKILCAVTSFLSVTALIAISAFAPDKYEALLLSNNSFGYFSALSQFPCFCLGMLLYFELKELKLTRARAGASAVFGAVIFITSGFLFFNPIFKYSYIIMVSLVGLATYFILKAMIYVEEFFRYSRLFTPIIKIGNKLLYVYLTHAFFVWPFVSVVKRALSLLNINSDTYLWFVLLLPVVIALSYISGHILQKSTNIITSVIFKSGRNDYPRKGTDKDSVTKHQKML